MPDVFDEVADKPDIFDQLDSAPAKDIFDQIDTEPAVSANKAKLLKEQEALRKEGERQQFITDAASGAFAGMEALTPHGLFNQPNRILGAVSGVPVPDINFTGYRPPKIEGPEAWKGAVNVLGQTAAGFADPESLLTLPAGGAGTLGKALFALPIVKEMPEKVQHAIDVWRDPNATPAQQTEAIADPTVSAAFLKLISHIPESELVSSARKAASKASELGALPKSAQAALDASERQIATPQPISTEPSTIEPQSTEVSNASSEQEAATLHGDVRPQPEPSTGEVPAAQSSGGIQSREEPAGTGNAPAVSAKAPRAEAAVNPDEALLKSIEDADGQQFAQIAKGLESRGGITGAAYEIGQAVRTPEELARLKAAQEAASAQLTEAKEKWRATKDMSALEEAGRLAVKPQFFREAYEAATGTGSAGDTLRKRDPNYQPPLPEGNVPRETNPTPAPKWASATDEPALGAATYGPFGIPSPTATYRAVADLVRQAFPHVRAAAKAVVDTGKAALGDLDIQKLNDRRKAILNWSAKLQRSFGEADAAQRDIRSQVSDPVRREGITNWIQADGDTATLTARRDATTDPTLRKGYQAALDLTPDEIAVAKDVKTAFDALGKRGQQFGVLDNFRDNYVTQIWNLRKGPAMGSARTLKDNFRFSRARTFDTYFDGEQAGFVPKTKDIAKILPVYLHEMNNVIAARQLVAELSKGVASDGRPLVVPRGVASVVDGPKGEAVLVQPNAMRGKIDTRDYKRLENQPALNDWIWAGKDTAGNPIFEKADLALHPEAYTHLKAILGKSAIKEWYGTRTTTLAQIPKLLVKGLDLAQSETKRTMLGFFAPFHQVQEGTHAVGHRVNPFFNNPKIDLVNNPAQMDAARHGLMLLPDRASANQFMEGFRTSGLVSRIPGIGDAADWYSHYLFHKYIPGIKFKTYEAILERNNHLYEKELASGQLHPSDVKALSAQQANAAYGHLNYGDMGRNPTIQHIMQLGLLAPDFLEARARFTGQAIKGTTGAKVGREQLLALATLAVAQAALAYTGAKLTGGEWDPKSPFEFRNGKRRYTMRSVPEDLVSFARDIHQTFEKGGETPFISNRLNPLLGRTGLQLVKGSDYRGQRTTPIETFKQALTVGIPITLKGAAGKLPWVGDMLKPNTPLSIPEQLLSAVGIKIQRYSPQTEVYKMADKWRSQSTNSKLVAQQAERNREVLPESSYKALRQALQNEDLKQAKIEYDKLLPTKGNARVSGATLINKAMQPGAPFTGSKRTENDFLRSLTPEEREIYDAAKKERVELYRAFQRMKQGHL